jgi:hypothetical protein
VEKILTFPLWEQLIFSQLSFWLILRLNVLLDYLQRSTSTRNSTVGIAPKFILTVIFNAYQESLQAFYVGENPLRPSLPGYRKKGGMHEITYPEQALKKKYDENGCPLLGFPLGWHIKKLYAEDMHQLDYIWLPYPTNIKNSQDIVEVTISPQNGDL